MGYQPKWYVDIQVAKYLNMSPTELAREPEQVWFAGYHAMNAEALAERQRHERQVAQQ